MVNPLFSILIANFNNANYIIDCINSILSQTYNHFEVIIVDDKSTDNSIEIIQDVIKNDSRFKLFTNDSNKGVGYTKKKLISLSSGEICAFLDGDDALVENAVEIMVAAHIENPNASIINSNLFYCDKDLNIRSRSNAKETYKYDPYFFNKEGEILHFATFKRSFYDKTEGMNPYFRKAEDQDLYLKLYEVGDHKVVTEGLYYYRCNPKSLIQTSDSDEVLGLHWYAIFRAAERRNLDVGQIISCNFINKNKLASIKKSKWARLGYMLGVFKSFKSFMDK